MKAYKDLDKTQECDDGDLVAVVVWMVTDELIRQSPWRPAIDGDSILDAEYISD